MPKLVYVIPEIHMGSQNKGLIKQMADRGINFSKLKNGDIVALLNRKENILRIMAVLPEKDSLGFLGSYRSPRGRVPLEAIQYISQCMGGGGFDMSKAIKMGLEQLLGKNNKEVVSE